MAAMPVRHRGHDAGRMVQGAPDQAASNSSAGPKNS